MARNRVVSHKVAQALVPVVGYSNKSQLALLNIRIIDNADLTASILCTER